MEPDRLGAPRAPRAAELGPPRGPGLQGRRSPRRGPRGPARDAAPRPSRDAVLIDDLADGVERDLVVIDGTWTQARNLYNHTPALGSLRKVKLSRGEKAPLPHARMQPRGECVSSLEAAVRALALEGGAERFEPVVALFDRMVDRHIERAHAADAASSAICAPSARGGRSPSCSPATSGASSSSTARRSTATCRRPAATRPTSSSGVRCVLQPTSGSTRSTGRPTASSSPPSSSISASRRSTGRSTPTRCELHGATSSRPGDHYVSWGYYATNALASVIGGQPSPHEDLRRATKVVLNRKVQRARGWPFELDLPPATESLARGRCGARLAAVRTILAEIRAMRGPSHAGVDGLGSAPSRLGAECISQIADLARSLDATRSSRACRTRCSSAPRPSPPSSAGRPSTRPSAARRSSALVERDAPASIPRDASGETSYDLMESPLRQRGRRGDPAERRRARWTPSSSSS